MAETARLTFSVPEMRARAMDEFDPDHRARSAPPWRYGRAAEPDDFAVRVLAGALIGVIMAASPSTWPRTGTWTCARCSAGPGASTRPWPSSRAASRSEHRYLRETGMFARSIHRSPAVSMHERVTARPIHCQGGSHASGNRRGHPGCCRGSASPTRPWRPTARCVGVTTAPSGLRGRGLPGPARVRRRGPARARPVHPHGPDGRGRLRAGRAQGHRLAPAPRLRDRDLHDRRRSSGTRTPTAAAA